MGRRSRRRVGPRALIGRARDDDENARWRCGGVVVVVAQCARRRVEYFAYFYVVSMTARSSEVDDEKDGWEEWERARVGFRGGVTDDG